jgi:hypothetical protein
LGFPIVVVRCDITAMAAGGDHKNITPMPSEELATATATPDKPKRKHRPHMRTVRRRLEGRPSGRCSLRLTLQRTLYRSGKFGDGDGRGHVTLLIRTILESEGNQDALIEPIVGAVSMCMRPEWTELGLRWIEAFDKIPLMAILQTMRGLDLFSERSLGCYYSIALRNKLAAILEPADSIGAPQTSYHRRQIETASAPGRAAGAADGGLDLRPPTTVAAARLYRLIIRRANSVRE